jgi:flagellar hook-associated protein 3 FlgL
MARVSTFGQSQSMLSALLANQRRVFDSQEQLNTGKISRDFKGLAGKSTTLINSRSFRSRVNSFQTLIESVKGKIDANDVQVNAVLTTARDFRQTIVDILAQDEAFAFKEIMEESFGFIADSLNAEIGGVFIFAGSKTNIKPFTGTKISDLTAATNASDLFVNDNKSLKVRVSDNVELKYGLKADEIALGIFDSYKRLADFDAGGSGPINGKLTTAQRTFLTTELGLLDTAIDNTQAVQTKNGLKAKRLITVGDQHKDTELFLDGFISDLEDTNMAEAITRLNIDQTALQASLQTLAILSDITLLDFI